MRKQNGFSLVEIIAVLVILALVGTAGTLGFVDAIRGYVFATDNVELAQKAQVALNRLNVELGHITYNPPVGHPLNDAAYSAGFIVTSSSRTNITFNTDYGVTRTGETAMTISYDGSSLLLNNVILCDDVSAFTFDYFTTSTETSPSGSGAFSTSTLAIGVNLTLTGANNEPILFQTRIIPKYDY